MAFRIFSGNDLAPKELQEHILSTYINIRVGIAVIGIAFPFLLWLGGKYLCAAAPAAFDERLLPRSGIRWTIDAGLVCRPVVC